MDNEKKVPSCAFLFSGADLLSITVILLVLVIAEDLSVLSIRGRSQERTHNRLGNF